MRLIEAIPTSYHSSFYDHWMTRYLRFYRFFWSFGVSKNFKASKLVLKGNFISDNDDDNNDKILFGESEFTSNLLKDYEKIFIELLQKFNKDWDVKDFYKHEIIKKIPIGCQKIPPPNVVILEPGENPNCDKNVHKACDMYFNDLDISNNNNLYVACDEAIFRR